VVAETRPPADDPDITLKAEGERERRRGNAPVKASTATSRA
jgi:hypothetical protein